MEKSPAPPLLPIFRSQQQAELLALVLGTPEREYTLSELAERTTTPYPSVHREIGRALATGLVTVRTIGRSKLVRADTDSPYFSGLADILTKAFGPPWVLAAALHGLVGIIDAYIYGSWAARHAGEPGERPVGDIDLLVLGNPDRDDVYAAVSATELRLGRDVQITIRAADWLRDGSGTFHDTVTSRPMLRLGSLS